MLAHEAKFGLSSDHIAQAKPGESPEEARPDSPGSATKPLVGATTARSAAPSAAKPSAEEVAFVDLMAAANLRVFLLPLREAEVTTAAAARAKTAQDEDFLSRLGFKKVCVHGSISQRQCSELFARKFWATRCTDLPS